MHSVHEWPCDLHFQASADDNKNLNGVKLQFGLRAFFIIIIIENTLM